MNTSLDNFKKAFPFDFFKPKRKNCREELKSEGITLEDLKKGEEYTVINVPEDPLLESLGFRPGKKIILKTKEFFKGPIICSVEGRNVAISREIARRILVESC